MDIFKDEMAALETAVKAKEELVELNELQLLLVGGGAGDVVFH